MGLLRVVSSLEVFLLLKGPFVFWLLFSPINPVHLMAYQVITYAALLITSHT